MANDVIQEAEHAECGIQVPNFFGGGLSLDNRLMYLEHKM